MFIKFQSVGKKNVNRITVTKTFSFGFPSKFFHDNNIEDYRYVVLYFDMEENAVGFHFTNDENEQHKFAIVKSKKGFGGSVVARSFFATNNIDPVVYKNSYEWEIKEIPEIGKLFVIKLINGLQSSAPTSVAN